MGFSVLACKDDKLGFRLVPLLIPYTINPSQFINDGETMVSAGGTFELGFFSPGKSTKRYLGIWYKKIPSRAVVWVANRETPLIYTSGVLMFTNLGDLVVVDHHRTVLWSTNASISVMNPVAQLLDSGNLVLRDGEDDNADNFLWQSFDHPGNTFLPGMKLKINLITGIDRHLSSWKSQNDPSQGCFTLGVDPRGYPQLVTRNGSNNQWASGPWNGLRFSGTPYLIQNPVFNARFIINQKEIYYTFDLVDNSVLLRAVLNQNGILEGSVWIDRTQAWNLYRITQTDNCDSYALCGAYGYCNFGKLACACLKGFVPKHPKEWNMMDWSNGCVRVTPLNCQKGDKFIKLSGLKLPDTRYSWFNDSMNLDECEIMCLRNCSCMAYSNLDISTGGSGCLLWFGDLIDIMELTENGQEIYVRMASSEVGPVGSIGKKGVKIRIVKIIISFAVLTGMLLIGLTLYIIWKWRMPSRQGKMEHNQESQQEDIELPLFDLATVANATNNFSFNNKLGVGGFGTVYKGVLEGGQEIAVKRLSRDSKQGLNEFKNEVLCIAKLQHRNLVKLLGCCIQEEKMLIYEYMPNKSLDSFIFDQTKRSLLNWDVRFNIISGIARGILYLHQDSRLRIIHRDLKASNILLDYEMNPKISDFGMATIFGGNQTQAKTTKLVGTYGYMSPEYQSDGLYSVKSDVFSFGVLVLEIVSGKRNSVFQDHHLNLLEYAWTFYNEGRTMELIDASMGELCNLSQVLRSIHVGLLCIQDNPEDRPSMLDVVVMLSSESALPQPTQPSFFTGRSSIEDGDFSSNKHEIRSSNGMSVTILVGR